MTYTGYASPNDNFTDVYTIELDKTKLNQLTHLAASNGFAGQSTFDRTGNVFYSSDSALTGTSVHIYTSDVHGQLVKRLTDGLFNDLNPALSPKAAMLSFNRAINITTQYGKNINTAANLYKMNVDGSNLVQVTSFKNGTVGHSCWSIDGTQIYFVYTDSTSKIPHVFVINADGTGQTQLTSSAFGDEYPALSPDGKTLAIASYMDQTHQEQEICFMNTDGTNLRKITNLGNTTVAHNPCWSPVGDKIFFACYDHAKVDPVHIFSANLDGSNVQPFTSGNGEEFPFIAYTAY